MGKTKFEIENCVDKPELAFKLYLIGKSLGLEPVFKDGKGLDKSSETLQNILNSTVKLRMRDNGQEESMKELYEKIKNNLVNPEELRTWVKNLQIQRPVIQNQNTVKAVQPVEVGLPLQEAAKIQILSSHPDRHKGK
jgi:uncharacterized protein YheU (UPF0270 family)